MAEPTNVEEISITDEQQSDIQEEHQIENPSNESNPGDVEDILLQDKQISGSFKLKIGYLVYRKGVSRYNY
ncbi:hypothetical protein COD67_19025 [Bacillus cereus]|nr:hypothetical protein COI89_13415 [Bacillus cereus]PGU64235.1 hypothetical protein COD67_19025 [Bacillus cereus]